MAEDNAHSQPQPDQPNDPHAAQPPQGAPVEKKRKKRRWPKVVGGVVVLLLLLVIFAPTIASTGMAKSMILNVVNGNLDGKAEVADWSLGWNSGITLNGVKLRDERGDVILQASRIRTELSLLKALKSGFGDLALGRTDIDNLDLTNIHVDPQGTPNVAKVAKASKKKAAKEPSPGTPMKISGDIHVNNMTGNVTSAGLAQKLHINPSNMVVALTGLNDPIKNDVQLSFTVEDPSNGAASSTPGSISLTGDADLFDNDRLNLDTATVKEQLKLANVDVAALNPFLAIAKLKLNLAGLANGVVDVNLQGLANAAATGEITVAKFVAGGEALNGDEFRSNLTVPIKIRRVGEGKNGGVLKVDDLRIVTDYGYVGVTADASQDSLQRLAELNAPGREGHVTVTANFDQAARLLNSMPRTLKLLEGVKIDSGHVFAQADGWLYPDRVVTKTQLNVADVAGTNKTGKIALTPVTSTVDVTYVPTHNAPTTIAQLRDIGVALESAFAKLNGETGKGGTLAQFTLAGNGSFAELQQQLGQFIDMGAVQLLGTWTLKAGTNGDPTKPDAAIATNAQFTVNNLTIKGIADYPPIVQPWLDLTASGDLHLEDNAPRSVTGGVVKLKSNNPDQPTVDLLAKGDLDLKTLKSEHFEVALSAALAKARQEFGPIVSALNYLESGQVNASAAGSYDGKTITLSTEKPLAVKASKLVLRQSAAANAPVVLRDQSVDVNFAGRISVSDDEVGADVTTLSVAAPQLVDVRKNPEDLKLTLFKKSTKLTGTGGLTVFADFKRLGDISKSLSPPPAPGTADSAAGELTKGLLNGTLTFTRGDKPFTTIAGNFTADVGVTTNKEPINDKISITLKGDAPDDLTQPLMASVDIKSDMINAAVSDAELVLAHQLADKTKTAFNGPFELLNKAKIRVNADRLEALQPMLASFSPPTPVAAAPPPMPAAQPSKKATGNERISAPEVEEGAEVKPLPPLRILSGKLALNSTVSREGRTTLLKDTTVDLANLSFQRGDGYYESKDKRINLKLAAAVNAADSSNTDPAKPPQSALAAVQKIEIRELAGDLDVGQLKLIKPIVLTNLATSPAATGAIELQGQLAETFRMLEAFRAAKAGSQYPYTGEYIVSEEVTTQGDTIRLAGSIKASHVKAYDPKNLKQVTFAEDLLSITNDVSADAKTDTATIRDFTLNMQSTGALALAISNGQVVDWAVQRKIADQLKAHLHVDWPKLWVLVKPMLDPDTLKSLEDLEIAGVMDRDFVVTGSLPTMGKDKRGRDVNLTFAQALRFLNASGGLKIDRVFLSGLEVRDLDLPVSMSKGIVHVMDATKPKGQEYPRPFLCNDGTIDLGGVQVDLRHVGPDGSIVPWFTIPDANKMVMKNVSFNALLAGSTLGNYVNPGFSGAQDARGRLTLSSVECRDVPLDWFTASKKDAPGATRRDRRASRSDGRGEFLLAISQMELQAPILPLLLRTDRLSGEVRKGQIVVENGIVKSDIPMELDGGRMTLAWSGSVNLQDRRIINFNTAIPKDLLADLPLLRDKNVAKFIPNVVNVPISGPFDSPKVDLAAAVTASVKSFIPGIGSGKPEDIIGDLLGGKKKDKPAKGDEPIGRDPKGPRSSTDDRNDVPNNGNKPKTDTVGGLLDAAGGLLGQKDKKKDDRKDMRDRDTRDPRDPGEQRISAEPPRVSGDQPISADPKSVTPATSPTTQPATQPATQRNVSGRTRGTRAPQ